ncbi:hypothetical protein [Flavobacterium commune]|nr:hypothetical protein [Flavobacterium commune]
MGDLGNIHENCKKIFRENLFSHPLGNYNGFKGHFGGTKASDMYYKFIYNDNSKRNSIGENFHQLINRINDNWFENYKPTNDLDYYFFNYFLLLYLFVERVDVIFKAINKEYKYFENFPTLQTIRKWSNFIKHPKEFLFTYWPIYYLEGSFHKELLLSDLKIDKDFIFKHYGSVKSERPLKLKKNCNVFVEVPDLENITKEFCDEMNFFFDLLCSNQILIDHLANTSTIEDYFDEDYLHNRL